MRIESTPPIRTNATRREERNAPTAGRAFQSNLAGEAPAQGAGPAQGLGAIAGLFALQEVGEHAGGRKRALQRGQSLLDRLEELRLALLQGTLPRARLADLARMLAEATPVVDDPRLEEILAEIELRVAVELAKLDAVL